MTITTSLFALALFGGWLVTEPRPQGSAAKTPLPEPSARSTADLAPPSADAAASPDRTPVWVSFERLRDVRILPVRPKDCASPPPGGRWQLATIEAARGRACREALDSWSLGMDESEDHCSLARAIWFCFEEAHVRILEEARPESFDSFLPYLVHLEGPSLESPSEPASGGLELRLEAIERDARFRRSLIDLLGAPRVASQIAEDVRFEINIALSIANTPASERTAAMEQVWARRAFVIANALRGETGLLLQSELPEQHVAMRAALTEATHDAPPIVHRSLAAAWEIHQ